MPGSPLEIYEKAYRLHYEENNIPAACEIYKKIIAEFPQSNESGYAAIQLQKIHASDVIDQLGDKQGPPSSVMGIAALIVSVVVLAGFGVAGYFYSSAVQKKTDALSKTSLAVSLLYTNNDDEALKIMNEVKQQSPSDMTPYVLSAQIYAKRGDYLHAKAEYDALEKITGGKQKNLINSLRLNMPEEDAALKNETSSSGNAAVEPPPEPAAKPMHEPPKRITAKTIENTFKKEPSGHKTYSSKEALMKQLDTLY